MASSNYADFMREERHNVTPIIHQLSQLLNSDKNWVCALFEGKDESDFYYSELRKRAQQIGFKTEKLVCRGKRGVIDVFYRTEGDYKDCSELQFFVDKDFDDYLGKKDPKGTNFFVTNYYSIENYLVNLSALEIIWEDFFHRNLTDKGFARIKLAFTSAHKEFVERIKPLMEWALACRLSKETINLNNIDFRNFRKMFSVDEELKLTCSEDYVAEFKKLTSTHDIKVSSKVMQKAEEVVGRSEDKFYVRGKYELFFFLCFCNALGKNLKKEPPAIKDLYVYVGRGMTLPRELVEFFDVNFNRLESSS